MFRGFFVPSLRERSDRRALSNAPHVEIGRIGLSFKNMDFEVVCSGLGFPDLATLGNFSLGRCFNAALCQDGEWPATEVVGPDLAQSWLARDTKDLREVL